MSQKKRPSCISEHILWKHSNIRYVVHLGLFVVNISDRPTIMSVYDSSFSGTSGQHTEKDMPLMCWRAMRERDWYKRGGYRAWMEVNAWWATLQGNTRAAQDSYYRSNERWYSEWIILIWGMLLICLGAGRKSQRNTASFYFAFLPKPLFLLDVKYHPHV